ncbi:MAG: DUF1345 domain-containing protein [Micropruina sp.]|uniref:DUF1345 domain-containing protein n=1 Tax=Micropruina sp. TaxID=2737536 RepID=UPI0039E36905
MKLQPAWVRSASATVVGAVLAVALWGLRGPAVALASGWIALTVTYVAWTAISLIRLDPEQTRVHATQEDPSHGVSITILSLASVASVAGVAFLLLGTRAGEQVPVEALLGALVVVCSWVLVHTLYTVHYGRLYYAEPDAEPIDFGGDKPDYQDFAYLAFTLGMTYQVSDTNLRTRGIRRAALRHALLSYLLGAVVLACTINLVVQLASTAVAG